MVSSVTEKLNVEVRGNTAVVTISNPPANTWDPESLAGLVQLVADCDADQEIYAMVLVGEGEKFFSAGADLKLFADGDKGVVRRQR